MCVRTDENPEVFVLCGFRRPGANARGETRKNSKKWRLATFSTVAGGFSKKSRRELSAVRKDWRILLRKLHSPLETAVIRADAMTAKGC